MTSSFQERSELKDVDGTNPESEANRGTRNSESDYGAVVLAVAHDAFRSFDPKKLKEKGVILFDVKGFFDKDVVDQRL